MRLAGALILAALPATAGDVSFSSRFTVLPGDGRCYAIVEVINKAGAYNRTETLDTEHGPITVEYDTIGGHRPGANDQVYVRNVPDGVAAWPMHIDLPDGDTGYICLMEWSGA